MGHNSPVFLLCFFRVCNEIIHVMQFRIKHNINHNYANIKNFNLFIYIIILTKTLLYIATMHVLIGLDKIRIDSFYDYDNFTLVN